VKKEAVQWPTHFKKEKNKNRRIKEIINALPQVTTLFETQA
jgi:hypothetical protein